MSNKLSLLYFNLLQPLTYAAYIEYLSKIIFILEEFCYIISIYASCPCSGCWDPKWE